MYYFFTSECQTRFEQRGQLTDIGLLCYNITSEVIISRLKKLKSGRNVSVTFVEIATKFLHTLTRILTSSASFPRRQSTNF
jgi:hypothetical protein